MFAFEKADAKDKYGGENIFQVTFGGRSLRFTAEMVYSSSFMSHEEADVKVAVEVNIY